MAQLVRKQFYIDKRLAHALKRVARARGVSEAEVIREGVGKEVAGGNGQTFQSDHDAFEKLLKFARSRSELPSDPANAYKWKRDDAYEERTNRWFPDQQNAPDKQ
jgi:hypothetical protein